MPLGKLYLEVSKNTSTIKGVLFWRANIQWCGLWKIKVGCKQLHYLPVCHSLFSPNTCVIQILPAGHFSPFKWLLARPKLGCTILFHAAKMMLQIQQVPLEPGKLDRNSIFFVFKQQGDCSGCSVFPPPAPRRSPLSPSHGNVPPWWAPWRWAGFCAVAVSHGCRKPFQGQAKGVGGSSLIEPGFRTTSALSSLEEYGLKGLRPREGWYSLKHNERQIFWCDSVGKCCVQVPWRCSKQGYIKHSSCSLHSGAGGQCVAKPKQGARAQRDVLEGYDKEFPRGGTDMGLNKCLSLALLLFNV